MAEKEKDMPKEEKKKEKGILKFYPYIPKIIVEKFPFCEQFSTSYMLTSLRLVTHTGTFNRKTNYLELHRVYDIKVERPALYRLFEFVFKKQIKKRLLLGDIYIFSRDYTDPKLVLSAIPNAYGVVETIRIAVEEAKTNIKVIYTDAPPNMLLLD
ncbi:PH domain-containing protein [Dolichospermum sp. LEGE 00240]|uniref:PH domain-containing protein n=1 Tax=Dolichospermum sp. LEGE 00240 TaxID=1828603 RepID=UPI00187F269C|nr:PH domain-containing protein [Dolichospermum sp. LEGE 00240]MBE9251868.1 PH domain-containing protein [Dolichospermum sp. LEGE 00240]MDM3849221.1 PH domain-containing protein [Aphanizomenon gracile PMC627.10]